MVREDKHIFILRMIANVLVLLCGVAILGIGINSQVLHRSEDYMEVGDGWVNEDGTPADITRFDNPDGKSVYITFDKVGDNHILIFSARNMFTDIYVNEKLVSKDDRQIKWIYGTSPGTRWRFLALEPTDKPVQIKITGYNCFESAGYLDNVYTGEMSDVNTKILTKNLFRFFLGFFWVVLAIACIIIYLTSKKKFALKKDFLYLSAGTLFCSLWCSAETNLWQFFIGYSEQIHMISYLSLFVIPVPFALLLCYRLRGKWQKASIVYAFLAELNVTICVLLHVLRIKEFHYTSWTVRILIVILLPFAIKLIHGYSLSKKAKKFAKFLYGGFALLVAFIAIGIIYYMLGKYSLYASFIRWALFFLLFILFGYQFTGMSDVFVKGLQSEFLHEMALTDHLTKFYNRAGFAEHRSKYENPKHPIGIIQFDVNNLKSVNDNQGHEKGDELICLASSGIYESFATKGACYRMGGDEFLVILTGENPEEDYKNGLELLEVYCSYANSVEDRTFDVKIAHGFTIKKDDETVNNAMERADSLMYENKKMMKANKT